MSETDTYAYYLATVERWKQEPYAIEQLVATNIRLHSEKVELQVQNRALIERNIQLGRSSKD